MGFTKQILAAAALAVLLLAQNAGQGAAAGAGPLTIQRMFPSTGAQGTGGGGGGGGTANLVSEDFEGTGIPSGWTTETGSADFDNATAPAPLVGSQSLSLGTANASTGKTAIGNKAEVWGYFVFRSVTTQEGGTLLFQLRDSSDNACLGVDFNGNLLRVYGDGGTPLVSTVATVSADTTYHFWFHYKQGASAGTDIGEIWFNTSGTKPADGSNNHAKVTTGTGQKTVDRFFIMDEFGNVQNARIVYDKFRLGDTGDLGSNPS